MGGQNRRIFHLLGEQNRRIFRLLGGQIEGFPDFTLKRTNQRILGFPHLGGQKGKEGDSSYSSQGGLEVCLVFTHPRHYHEDRLYSGYNSLE